MTDDLNRIASHIENLQDPETFSIAEFLLGRDYAEDQLEVILNDKIGYAWEAAAEELKSTADVGRIAYLNDQLEDLSELAKKFTFTLHFHGISEDMRDAVMASSVEQYPRKYNEYINVLTGSKVREEIENPTRDRLHTNLLWQAHLGKIVSPDGRVQSNIELEDVAVIRGRAPYSTLLRIAEMIDKLRVATRWQDQVINEDF